MTKNDAAKTGRLTPQRSCVACRTKRAQSGLLRITRGAEGWEITGPDERRRPGRGAYVCADQPGCWEAKRLGRAFRGQAPEVSARLQAYADTVPGQATQAARAEVPGPTSL